MFVFFLRAEFLIKKFFKKFKNGAFRLAIENDIKIIPVSIADNRFLFQKNTIKDIQVLQELKYISLLVKIF